MELIVFWLILVGLIAWWANEWGRTWVAWAVVAFFLSPLIAGIALAIRGRKVEPRVQYAPQPVAPPLEKPRTDYPAILSSLADLKERGAISEAEYDAKKADLLARM